MSNIEITDITLEETKNTPKGDIHEDNYILINTDIDLSEEVGCPFKCNWMGALKDLKMHKSKCDNSEIKCTLCDLKLILHDLGEHLDKCPERKTQCDLCYTLLSAQELEAHKKVCDKRVVKCSLSYCDFKTTADEIGKHEKDMEAHLSTYLDLIKTLEGKNEKLIKKYNVLAKTNNEWYDYCKKQEETIRDALNYAYDLGTSDKYQYWIKDWRSWYSKKYYWDH